MTMTTQDLNEVRRVNARLERELECAAIEIAALRHQIRETIMENLHLADGDNCTLKRLKDSIGFELDADPASDGAASSDTPYQIKMSG